ncbi:hypothetical protein ACEQ8H_006097 [Pleosporales sp. CAS-2024a]
MGKKKSSHREYNEFVDGEKLRDNNEIRTSLQDGSTNGVSSTPTSQKHRHRKSRRLTHFLCLPLVTETSLPQFQAGLSKLRDELSQDPVVPLKAVRPLGTLHLTVGVMSLFEPRISEAISLLQSLDLGRILRDLTQRDMAPRAAEQGTIAENLNAAALPDMDYLSINLCGLEPMHTPEKTSILYAKPTDEMQRLYPFACALRDEFASKGLLEVKKKELKKNLKLHATIINTIYAKPERVKKSRLKESFKHLELEGSPHHDATKHEDGAATSQDEKKKVEHQITFDAREMIERYKDFTWAKDVRIDRVQICKMGSKKVRGEPGQVKHGHVLKEQYEVVAEKRIVE